MPYGLCCNYSALHCGMKSSHKHTYEWAWLCSIKLFTKTGGRQDLATVVLCKPLLESAVMMGDLNDPQFNHLLPYVGQASTIIYAKTQVEGGKGNKFGL